MAMRYSRCVAAACDRVLRDDTPASETARKWLVSALRFVRTPLRDTRTDDRRRLTAALSEPAAESWSLTQHFCAVFENEDPLRELWPSVRRLAAPSHAACAGL